MKKLLLLKYGLTSVPTSFIAVVDILLTALDMASIPHPVSLMDAHGDLHLYQRGMYADDLLAVTASRTSLQQTADVICACMLFLGLVITIPKLRLFAVYYGNDSALPKEAYLTLHTTGWTPVEVLIPFNGTFKYLGVDLSVSLDNRRNFHLILEDIVKKNRHDRRPSGFHYYQVLDRHSQCV
jgi:hypothetical protein